MIIYPINLMQFPLFIFPRFWVAVRFQQLYFVERFHRVPLVGELVIQSAFIGWAFHSDCQETLFDSLLSNEPSWQEMRDIGIGFWYTNVSQLRSKVFIESN